MEGGLQEEPVEYGVSKRKTTLQWIEHLLTMIVLTSLCLIANTEVSDVKNITRNLCRFCNVRQSVKHILLECSFRNLERKREVFFENYKKYTGDFIFLGEDAKLREVLNVNLNVRQKTQLRQ